MTDATTPSALSLDDQLAALMRADGQPELAITAFLAAHATLMAGATGRLPEAAITPVYALPDVADLTAHTDAGRAALSRLAILKLNGGLGTSMGMDRAKSLLPVRGERTLLDLIADQVIAARAERELPLPLILMDSFRTQADTEAALARLDDLKKPGIPLSFRQHRVPKIDARLLGPVTEIAAELGSPELAWCPPGHGDLYLALATSGTLQALRDAGIRWLFVSNADNLGATLDDDALAILGWMATEALPLVMECTRRTEADMKGGHLARGRRGGLLLRELAQCPDDDLNAFRDIERHTFFNTNNLWLDLDALAALIQTRGGTLGLPLIRNIKPLDPAHPSGLGAAPIYQLETALGAAIGLFPNAAAVEVPRDRFAPIKTTGDLLLVRSDYYEDGPGGHLTPRPSPRPIIDLDPKFFGNINDFDDRVQAPPSLVGATRLTVRGDIVFGPGVVVHGDVTITHEGPKARFLHDILLEG